MTARLAIPLGDATLELRLGHGLGLGAGVAHLRAGAWLRPLEAAELARSLWREDPRVAMALLGWRALADRLRQRPRPLLEELCALLVTGDAVLRRFDAEGASGHEEAEPEVVPARPATPRPVDELSYYEVRLVDELDAPIADVKVLLGTPAGSFDRTTDGTGRARVDGVPPGFGHASVDAAQLALRLAGRHLGPRRTHPLVAQQDQHVRTMRTASDLVVLPDALPQTLMVVTRTDVHHARNATPWGALALAEASLGSCDLQQCGQAIQTRLRLHADASALMAQVVAPAPAKPVLPAPLAELPIHLGLFVPPDLYVVQPGDTLVRLAKRYLGDANRWKEIWALNHANYPKGPDVLFPGNLLHMPPEAVPAWVALPFAAPPAPLPAPQTTELSWLSVAIDAVHDALFDGDFAAVFEQLAALPVEVPPVVLDAPPPFFEELVYRQTMVELALAGHVDPPFAVPPEEPNAMEAP